MKWITGMFLFISFSVLAAPTLKLTSFHYTNGSANKTAEVCGVVTGATDFPTYIHVVADPKNNPGHYQTYAAPTGEFCQVIVSYYGSVAAEIITGGQAPSANQRDSRFIDR